jgi:hypothetical protein
MMPILSKSVGEDKPQDRVRKSRLLLGAECDARSAISLSMMAAGTVSMLPILSVS